MIIMIIIVIIVAKYLKTFTKSGRGKISIETRGGNSPIYIRARMLVDVFPLKGGASRVEMMPT